MLVINDNKMKLLKMKEKLLEVSNDNHDKTLEDYAKLALEIDNDCYNLIINEIKDTDYNSLSLEEQIKYLSEIEDDYNYLNQLQWMIRKTYGKYDDNELKLSDISVILIDKIIQRISDIQGYLMNIKNLESNKIELDRLNYQLISLDKENEQTKKIMLDIKNKLRNEIIKAEGRVYNYKGSIEAISIVSEFKKYGINLKEIVDDSEKLRDIFRRFNEEKETQEETFRATINLPNRDEEICKQIELETIQSEYKYCLIELVNEVCMTDTEYNLFKNSLYKIADIIKSIKGYLQKIGIKFYINPFDRIKIESQIQVFNSIPDYKKEINNVKKTITYVSLMIDDATRKNQELMVTINSDIKMIDDNTEKETETIHQLFSYEDNDDNNKTFSDIVLSDDFKDNQVVSLKELNDNFKVNRAHEKTDGVIKRVYEMFNNIPVVTSDVKSPELLLEPIGVSKNELNNEDSKSINSSAYIEPVQNITLDLPFDFPNEVMDDLTVDNSDNIFLDDDKSKNINNDLFQEVEPFEETPLFSDKYDSDIFQDNNSKMIIDLSNNKIGKEPFGQNTSIVKLDKKKENNELNSMMPDAFWVTKDDQMENEENNVLSFDEQVAALMKDNEQIKIKKKAA